MPLAACWRKLSAHLFLPSLKMAQTRASQLYRQTACASTPSALPTPHIPFHNTWRWNTPACRQGHVERRSRCWNIPACRFRTRAVYFRRHTHHPATATMYSSICFRGTLATLFVQAPATSRPWHPHRCLLSRTCRTYQRHHIYVNTTHRRAAAQCGKRVATRSAAAFCEALAPHGR